MIRVRVRAKNRVKIRSRLSVNMSDKMNKNVIYSMMEVSTEKR